MAIVFFASKRRNKSILFSYEAQIFANINYALFFYTTGNGKVLSNFIFIPVAEDFLGASIISST
jgi:hypothetical protein